ncbi:MAG: ribosome maturation factor RimM [Alphaproteobacteria bacterium]
MTGLTDSAGAEPMVLVGVVVGAHGVRGGVRIKSFTEDPAAIGRYRPLLDGAGRRLELRVVGQVKDALIATIKGVADRNAVEAMRGTRIFVPRSALPPPDEEEFYHADLIGLAAETADGRPYGRVVAVANHGAGDVLEVQLAVGPPVVLPFTRAAVPVVDIAGGRVVVDPPAGLVGPAESDDGEERGVAP